MVKKILSILVWILTVAGIMILFIFARDSYMNLDFKAVNVNIERSGNKGFINKEKAVQNILKVMDTTKNKQIRDINMLKIQKMLLTNPWIESASVFADLEGNVNVSIKEYKPTVRVYNKENESVYLTDNGEILPSNLYYAPRVLIANGELNFSNPKNTASVSDSLYMNTHLDEILELHKQIESDPFLQRSVEQIYINQDQEYELTLRNCPASIMVGDMSNIEDKLLRMSLFFQQKTGSEELNNYKKINIKYNNQIVCTK